MARELREELDHFLAILDSVLANLPPISCSYLVQNPCAIENQLENHSKALSCADRCYSLSALLSKKCNDAETRFRNMATELRKSEIRKNFLETRLEKYQESIYNFDIPPANSLTESVCQLMDQKRKFDNAADSLQCICIANALHRSGADY